MPHFKCEECRSRFYSAASAQPAGGACPECGALLEPVVALAEVVGYRAIVRSGAESDRHELIAARIGDLVARREVARAQARCDAERWLDDGGRLAAEAVALAHPPPDRN